MLTRCVLFLLLNLSNMFFKHSKSKNQRVVDSRADGHVRKFPESPVNPMYKPRTLSELRALFDHTGINPAPVQLRDGLPNIEGLDPMDTPPIPIGGDTFERIRQAKAIENDLNKLSESTKVDKTATDNPLDSSKLTEPSQD